MARPYGRHDDYTGRSMHCIVCTNPIPSTRKKDAVTCGPECSAVRKAWSRSRMDQTKCRYCFRPSTPAERAAFNRWRKWEAKQAEEAAAAAPEGESHAEGATDELVTVPNSEEEESTE
jgi:hypothetical protein